jgi:hypothetical protein
MFQIELLHLYLCLWGLAGCIYVLIVMFCFIRSADLVFNSKCTIDINLSTKKPNNKTVSHNLFLGAIFNSNISDWSSNISKLYSSYFLYLLRLYTRFPRIQWVTLLLYLNVTYLVLQKLCGIMDEPSNLCSRGHWFKFGSGSRGQRSFFSKLPGDLGLSYRV